MQLTKTGSVSDFGEQSSALTILSEFAMVSYDLVFPLKFLFSEIMIVVSGLALSPSFLFILAG